MSQALTPGVGIGQSEGALARAADRVADARSDLLGLAEQLTGRLENLTGHWAGAGATAFGQVHLAWQDQQRRIVGALDRLSASLLETERATIAADATQGEGLSRTAARLGGL